MEKITREDIGREIEVVETYWNDTTTSDYIGEVGQIASASKLSFVDIYVRGKMEIFHSSEIKLKEGY